MFVKSMPIIGGSIFNGDGEGLIRLRVVVRIQLKLALTKGALNIGDAERGGGLSKKFETHLNINIINMIRHARYSFKLWLSIIQRV